MEKHAACWQELENQPGCFWWTEHYHDDRTASWSGRCDRGLAVGHGTLSLTAGSEHRSREGTGSLAAGKVDGRWVVAWSDGARGDFTYRNGKVNGYGEFTYADGDRYQGEWRDGRRHGRGTFSFQSGSRYEGEWRDGKAHGYGTAIWDDGGRDEGQWSGGCVGTRDGNWMTLGASATECGFE